MVISQRVPHRVMIVLVYVLDGRRIRFFLNVPGYSEVMDWANSQTGFGKLHAKLRPGHKPKNDLQPG